MERLGLGVAKGGIANTFDEAVALLEVTIPSIIRPSYSLVPAVTSPPDPRIEEIVRRGLDLFATKQILVERSLIRGRSSSWRSCATATTTW